VFFPLLLSFFLYVWPVHFFLTRLIRTGFTLAIPYDDQLTLSSPPPFLPGMQLQVTSFAQRRISLPSARHRRKNLSPKGWFPLLSAPFRRSTCSFFKAFHTNGCHFSPLLFPVRKRTVWLCYAFVTPGFFGISVSRCEPSSVVEHVLAAFFLHGVLFFPSRENGWTPPRPSLFLRFPFSPLSQVIVSFAEPGPRLLFPPGRDLPQRAIFLFSIFPPQQQSHLLVTPFT